MAVEREQVSEGSHLIYFFLMKGSHLIGLVQHMACGPELNRTDMRLSEWTKSSDQTSLGSSGTESGLIHRGPLVSCSNHNVLMMQAQQTWFEWQYDRVNDLVIHPCSAFTGLFVAPVRLHAQVLGTVWAVTLERLMYWCMHVCTGQSLALLVHGRSSVPSDSDGIYEIALHLFSMKQESVDRPKNKNAMEAVPDFGWDQKPELNFYSTGL